jgi:hypothetical protein
MINKKIASEIGVGVTLLISIVIGGVFWMQNKANVEQITNIEKNPKNSESVAEVNKAAMPLSGVQQNEVTTQKDKVSIKWLTESREIGDIEIFSNTKSAAELIAGYGISQIGAEEVGEVMDGEYAGSKILLVIIDAGGLSGPSIFRFIQKPNEKRLFLLKNYSSADIYDYGIDGVNKDGILNAKFFSAAGYVDNLKIDALEYPEEIVLSNGVKLKNEDKFPIEISVNSQDGNVTYSADFDPKFLKIIFNDSVYGDLYTTDATKTSGINASNIYTKNGFYLKAADGTFSVYSEVIELGSDVPNILWNSGAINESVYGYQGESGCGASSYAEVMNNVDEEDLFIIGKAVNGDNVFGLSDRKNRILTDYYNADIEIIKKDGIEFFGDKKFTQKTSYNDFLNLYPMFFWKDSFGRIIRFINSEVKPSGGGCGKPVIYLYPEQTQDISVKVTPTDRMTVSDPAYNDGWHVNSDSLSNITNLVDGKKYPYLFWEGYGKDVYDIPERGFVVERDNLNNFFDEKLLQAGLIGKEIVDFKDFWIPKMLKDDKPFYFVTFVDRKIIDKLAPLEINPKPDTIIRVLMDYRALENKIAVQGFNMKTPIRAGFTVVEWGGVLR